MDTPASRLNFRSTGNIIQLDVAATGFCFDLAIHFVTCIDPPAVCSVITLAHPISNSRRRTAPLRGPPPIPDGYFRRRLSLNVIPYFTDIDISAAA